MEQAAQLTKKSIFVPDWPEKRHVSTVQYRVLTRPEEKGRSILQWLKDLVLREGKKFEEERAIEKKIKQQKSKHHGRGNSGKSESEITNKERLIHLVKKRLKENMEKRDPQYSKALNYFY